MCGILGYSHLAGSLPAGLLTTAVEALVHRGPDHQGTFYSERMSLGATRLRILDLDGGDQPLFSSDRDVVVVFNGEIFNYPELRTELEVEGFRFETRCDTEVVLNAFLRWGGSCFSRFRGMFAIAIWVRSEGRLILARDRMGIKPLYYCLQNGEIYFGSELKCILLHPAVRRNICLSGLNCFLSLNYVPGPLTLVEGVVKLMPGHSLEWQSGRCRVRSYVTPCRCEQGPELNRRCLRGTGRPADPIVERATCFRPARWYLAQRRPGLIDHPALRRASASGATPNLFHHFSGTFIRREQIHQGSQPSFRHKAFGV